MFRPPFNAVNAATGTNESERYDEAPFLKDVYYQAKLNVTGKIERGLYNRRVGEMMMTSSCVVSLFAEQLKHIDLSQGELEGNILMQSTLLY